MRELMLMAGLEIILSLSENAMRADAVRKAESFLTHLEIGNCRQAVELYVCHRHRMEPDVRRRFERKITSFLLKT
ncbi:hypothetical protein QUF72_01540 [Desulfobacterales bacterium HSG2]|nr:hypothetical protein [Desulfobacterales bacterium HSG2]